MENKQEFLNKVLKNALENPTVHIDVINTLLDKGAEPSVCTNDDLKTLLQNLEPYGSKVDQTIARLIDDRDTRLDDETVLLLVELGLTESLRDVLNVICSVIDSSFKNYLCDKIVPHVYKITKWYGEDLQQIKMFNFLIDNYELCECKVLSKVNVNTDEYILKEIYNKIKQPYKIVTWAYNLLDCCTYSNCITKKYSKLRFIKIASVFNEYVPIDYNIIIDFAFENSDLDLLKATAELDFSMMSSYFEEYFIELVNEYTKGTKTNEMIKYLLDKNMIKSKKAIENALLYCVSIENCNDSSKLIESLMEKIDQFEKQNDNVLKYIKENGSIPDGFIVVKK